MQLSSLNDAPYVLHPFLVGQSFNSLGYTRDKLQSLTAAIEKIIG